MRASGPMIRCKTTDDSADLPDTGLKYSKVRIRDDLIFENYLSSGVVEIPEMETPAHVIILRSDSPSVIEWREKGRDRKAELPPGSVSLVPAGLRNAARVSRPLPGVASILQIQPEFVERVAGKIATGGRIELIHRMDLADAQIARLMESLRADIEDGSLSDTLFGESIAIALTAHIAQRYATMTARLETYRGGLSPARLNRVLDYIHANLGDKIELDTLAGVVGLNVYHFARAFKQSTGESPYQYVLRSRIDRAKEFLRQSGLPVIEASARTGFVDQSHFSKVFRRMVGVAPSEYRNMT